MKRIFVPKAPQTGKGPQDMPPPAPAEEPRPEPPKRILGALNLATRQHLERLGRIRAAGRSQRQDPEP